jgi:hypothetical protein
MIFQALTLASLGMLTRLLAGVSRCALYHISVDFNCVTFVVRVCRVVTFYCASWKMKSMYVHNC